MIIPPRYPEPEHPLISEGYRLIAQNRQESVRPTLSPAALAIKGAFPTIDGIILELGGGLGNFASTIAEQYPENTVISIDNDPEVIKIAQGQDTPDNLEFVCQDARDLKQFYGEVGLTLSIASLHHLGIGIIDNIGQCLKPGGILYLQDTDRSKFYDFTVTFDQLGASVPFTSFALKYRDFPDKDFYLRMLMEPVRGNDVYPVFINRLLTAFSLLASYTPDEVEIAVGSAGMTVEAFKTREDKKDFLIVAQKPR